MLQQLIRDVSRYRPDVIHVFKPKGFAGAAGTYFLLRGDPPVVLDCDDWEGSGGWNEIKSYPWIVKEYIDRQERWMMRSAQAVTVASRTLEDKAAVLRGSRDAVYYAPNCGASAANRELQQEIRTGPREVVRREFGFGDNPVVLYSGHSEDGESVKFFCRAVAKLPEKRHASIVFVGEQREREEEIRELLLCCQHLSVSFYSRLPYGAFLRLIWACDVAAFPYPGDAVHRAKCSARIVDYMAMGRAVLTSAVGQNREYIINGQSGLLANPSDEKDFADKLDRLLSDAELRRSLGESASRRVRQLFNWSGEPLQACVAAYERASPRFRELFSAAAETASRTRRSAA
jgi:glycosyltransferase involved in cell wall biosynthesis